MISPGRPTACFARNPRAPKVAPPAHATDCQLHVFGDATRYPPRPGAAYDPPADANIDALLAGHRAIGIERGVLVQPTSYAMDHRLLVDALAKAGKNYRGIALVDDSVSDAELARLHAAGVRGARFNFWKLLNMVPDHDEFLRSVARIGELGWHAKVHAQIDELKELVGLLGKVRIPIVIDHMSNLDFAKPLDHPDSRFVFDAVRGGWWIMLSNGDRGSAEGPPYNDAVRYGQALIAAAPDRTIWGSDWPHLRPPGDEPHEDAEILELLYRYAPDDAARRKVLVTNPATLFGFED
jgi:2-pyrone-4,6-dicarboxylate lactonase